MTATTLQVGEVVSAIEREFASQWAPPSRVSGQGEDHRVRAATLNYVVATPHGEREAATKRIDLASTLAPGRAFLLTVDPTLAPWDASFDVHGESVNADGEQIYHDRVSIAFGPMAASRAGSIIEALSLAEVPRVLDIEKHVPLALLEGLVDSSARVIVDSWAMAPDEAVALAHRTKGTFFDRGFARLFEWRELVARFFDEDIALAQEIKRVRIRVNAKPGEPRPASAALFAGWLGSRLGFRVGADGTVEGPKGPVAFDVGTEWQESVPKNALVAVEIEAGEGAQKLVASASRSPTPMRVIWKLAGAREAEHEVSLRLDDAHLESAALGKAPHGDVTIAALAWASQFARTKR